MIELLQPQPLPAAAAVLTLLGLLSGAALAFASKQFPARTDPVAERIDALLPQTQCGQCGYPGCRPYAEAVAAGVAINRCLPGGDDAIRAMADLLNVEPLPLDTGDGTTPPKAVAFIREAECIGCTKCIQACPVDAIVGAARLMHTVIAAECTGCDLCVDPCPVDCIEMRPLPDNGDLIASDRKPPAGTPDRPPLQVPEQPCIRCGYCADACPVLLQPQQLYWFSRDHAFDRLEGHHLFDCIECSGCDTVCPSHIPLVQHFREAKQTLRLRAQERTRAEHARGRFEARDQRLTQAAEMREAKRQTRLQAARDTPAQQSATEIQADRVQQAIDRARARHGLGPDAPPTGAESDPFLQLAALQRRLVNAEQRLAQARQQHSPKLPHFEENVAQLRQRIASLQAITAAQPAIASFDRDPD